MINEAIQLIKKQKDMYDIQLQEIYRLNQTKTVLKFEKKTKKEILLRKYILKILREYRNNLQNMI